MSEVKLGQLVTDDNQKRDAVHIAIIPAVALEELAPGQHVSVYSVSDDGTPYVGAKGILVGFVDPLLKNKVKPYQKILLWMYPNTVKQLSHDWEHPDIPKKQPKPPENTWDDYDRERCPC